MPVLALSACADSAPEDAATGRDGAPVSGSGIDRFYAQEPQWEECDSGTQCATVTVPLDHADPDGETVEIAVRRLPASGDDPIGSLLINPGGPGGSGTDLVAAVPQMFSQTLLERYDVVGFDPRGVNDSTAVDCVDDATLDEIRASDANLATPEDLDEYTAMSASIAEGCAARTGELLAHVDTVSAARDMDILRAVLGDDELHYLGYSYGTFLGATYAEEFPDKVGRLVLDGALDPTLSMAEVSHGQALGFEAALRDFIESCLAEDTCPLGPDVETGVSQVQRLLEQAAGLPLPTADDARPLTYPLALSGILVPLYDDALWPALQEALRQAMVDGDGSTLLFLADAGAERNPDGTYATNSNEAFWAVNCADYPVEGTIEDWRRSAEEMAHAAPVFGEALGYSEILCDVWPHESTAERTPLTAAGAAPILVVGTTGDPATPYEWSVSLADQLESATLLTYDGPGHTAYGRSNDCVTRAVDAYLVDGEPPADGTTC